MTYRQFREGDPPPWSSMEGLGLDGRMHYYVLLENPGGEDSDAVEVAVSLWQHPFVQGGKIPMNLAFA